MGVAVANVWAMTKAFRPYTLDPPDMRQWLPEGDLALLISDVEDELDLADLPLAPPRAETVPRTGVMLPSLTVASHHPAQLEGEGLDDHAQPPPEQPARHRRLSE